MTEISLSSIEKGIGLLTIDRPNKRNALTTDMRRTLANVVLSEEAEQMQAIVLHSVGPTFCAGADLNEVGTHESWRDRAAGGQICTAFRRARPVIIAAVQGHALGLGACIAMAADIVIASEDAQFGYPEVKHGLVAGISMVGLKQLVGQRQALELLVTGRPVGAQEALALGMVNSLAPDGAAALSAAQEFAARLSRDGSAVQVTKRFFYEAGEMPYTQGLQAGERVNEIARSSNETLERTAAFVSGSGHRHDRNGD